ncbi:hypothetical protein [Tropicibacter naphthalenivorans]|uniref:hypothetical protein n=1 Tax=Tropicibacter naphthalenivorans TaxID=441103 RepID=UPI00071D47FC|nr:hypothetical protein [Tropicibacter naphthalenivorans]
MTGDIVKSGALDASALDEVMHTLQTASDQIATWDPTFATFARRGGDGWQLAMGQPARVLRAALYLQASLRRMNKTYATRIAVAVGRGTFPDIDAPDPNAGHGRAFTMSGRLLEQLGGARLMAHARGGAQHAALTLADHIAQGWTQAQARAVVEMLPPDAGPRLEAAKRLNITRQAVDQALWAAGFPALETAITAWETI